MNKGKKSSTCAIHSPNSKSPSTQTTTTTPEQLQLISDEAEIKQVVKACIDDSDKESRVEEWVHLASEQVTEHLKSSKTEYANPSTNSNDRESISEAVEAIILDEQSPDNDLTTNTAESKEDDKLNGTSRIDSYHNNQTSDSDDEHIDLSSSIEDILDEQEHGKVSFVTLLF